MSGITNFLIGGKPKAPPSARNFTPMTDEESTRLRSIEDGIQNIYDSQSTLDQQADGAVDITALFKDHLTQFLTSNQEATPTPEQIAQATSFVDETFSKPAELALDQYTTQFNDAAAAKAAALGRNPNADLATQQAIAGETMRNRMQFQAERGSRIAQQAQQFNDAGFNRGLAGLQAGQAGSGFLNSLAQQAYNNRLGLLNAQTGLAELQQRDRSVSYPTPQHSSGLLSNISSIQNGFSNVVAGGSQNYNTVAGLIGGGGTGGGGGGGLAGGALSFFSDVALKTNIKDASADVIEFVKSIKPISFNYSNPAHGAGDWVGVTAQDLSISAAGKTLVIDSEEGKKVDLSKAVSLLLATQAVLLKRIEELESK